MVRVFRLVKKEYASRAFTGEGASLFGGRWNSGGNACVYTAGSESLAILEALVNSEGEALKEPFSLFELQFPQADARYLKPKGLPRGWRNGRPLTETAQIGDDWLRGGKTLALAVPSAIAPRDLIYILNPKHAGLERIVKKAKPLPFEFDVRLEKQKS